MHKLSTAAHTTWPFGCPMYTRSQFSQIQYADNKRSENRVSTSATLLTEGALRRHFLIAFGLGSSHIAKTRLRRRTKRKLTA